MMFVMAVLGAVAGTLTTLAGQGGGLLLLLACSALLGPHAALAVTSPALLVGNAHRAFLFRAAIDRGVALRVALGAVPGSFLGGLVAGTAPAWVLKVLLVGMTALVLGKALGLLRFTVPRSALAPAGAVVGAMTGSAGGAGVLIAPIHLSVGLTGGAFVGTTSFVALAVHLGRVVAYGSTGLFRRDLLATTAVLVLAIFAGNAVGERLRVRLPARATTRLELLVLVVCVALSVVGFA